MAIYRAIENGVVLVRQADNGLSIVADPYGRMLAATDHFTSSERVMVAQVPTYSVTTLYSYTPDWFAWLAMAGFVVIMIVGIIQGRRAKRAVTVQPESQPEPAS
jgi:apolipoprotein N-acyltransferase